MGSKRLLAAAAMTGLVLVAAACGSKGPVASTPVRSAPKTSQPASASASPTDRNPAGEVPRGFAATSVTFTSPDQAFALGTAPCADKPCTFIARTADRGASWTILPAPAVPVGQPGLTNAPVVWGIRFVTPEHGFVFGNGLWETTDGGRRWARDLIPAGSLLSLAIVSGQVLALDVPCPPAADCQYGVLMRRPLSGGMWVILSKATFGDVIDPDDKIATQAGVAAILDGRDVLVTSDGGLTLTVHPMPCPELWGSSVTPTSAGGLALLCTYGAYTGHSIKRVYVSGDDGAHWSAAGQPSPAGDGGTIAATSTGRLTIATASAASLLFYSGDAGTGWRTVNEQFDGGAGWADLGFTTGTDGVVIHGPADSDGNATQRPGQLFLTSDAGASWYQVTF